MKKFIRGITVLTLVTLLSACGFSLRGSTKASLPPQLQTLQLQSFAGNSDIAQETRRALSSNGIKIIDESQPGIYRLGIGSEQTTERVISVSSSARAGEYELTMTLPFELESNVVTSLSNAPDTPALPANSSPLEPAADDSLLLTSTSFIIEPETLVTQRNYQADPNNAVAKAEEAELIRNEMRQALINQILRRLQNLNL